MYLYKQAYLARHVYLSSYTWWSPLSNCMMTSTNNSCSKSKISDDEPPLLRHCNQLAWEGDGSSFFSSCCEYLKSKVTYSVTQLMSDNVTYWALIAKKEGIETANIIGIISYIKTGNRAKLCNYLINHISLITGLDDGRKGWVNHPPR